MSSAAPTAPDAAPEQAFRLADQVNRRPRAVRLLAAVRRHRLDLLAALVCAVLAGWVTHGLWPNPAGRTLALNPEDQALYEWFLAVDARALLGDFGLLTDRLNAPDGVNLMANTTVIALGIVFAPVTVLLGAPVTFALLAAANLAGTAFAWYLLFHRTLRARRLAAALGGGLCGFGPGMISQTNSHLHMTAQWLVPVIVWLVARLLRASDPGPTTLDRTGRDRSPGPDRRMDAHLGGGTGGRSHRAGLHRRGGALPRRRHAAGDGDQLRRGGPGPGPAGAARLRRMGWRSPPGSPYWCSATRCGSSSPARRGSPTGCSRRPTSPPT